MTQPTNGALITDFGAWEVTQDGVDNPVIDIQDNSPTLVRITVLNPLENPPFLVSFDDAVSAIPWTYPPDADDVPSWLNFPVVPL